MIISFTQDKFSDISGVSDINFDQLHKLFLDRLKYDGPKEGNLMYVMGDLEDEVPKDGKINRCDENVISMSALVFDIDNKAELSTVTDPFQFAALGCKCLLVSSSGSTRDFPRARIISPSTRPMTSTEYRRVQGALFEAFRRDHPSLDKAMITPSQAYYFPQQPLDKVNGYGFVKVIDGPLFDPDDYLKRLPPEKVKRKPKRLTGYDPLTLDQAVEALQFFDAGNDKDRFMTCLVFTKNFPFAQSYWEAWHRAGSMKWEQRKKFWDTEKNLDRGEKYSGVNIGWFVKEAKRRGWAGSQVDGGSQAKPYNEETDKTDKTLESDHCLAICLVDSH